MFPEHSFVHGQHALKAMEIDASPDFCHLDVASSETGLPICRSASISENDSFKSFHDSTCHVAVLSDGERCKTTAKVDLLQQLAEDSVVQALDLFVSFANLFTLDIIVISSLKGIGIVAGS